MKAGALVPGFGPIGWFNFQKIINAGNVLKYLYDNFKDQGWSGAKTIREKLRLTRKALLISAYDSAEDIGKIFVCDSLGPEFVPNMAKLGRVLSTYIVLKYKKEDISLLRRQLAVANTSGSKAEIQRKLVSKKADYFSTIASLSQDLPDFISWEIADEMITPEACIVLTQNIKYKKILNDISKITEHFSDSVTVIWKGIPVSIKDMKDRWRSGEWFIEKK